MTTVAPLHFFGNGGEGDMTRELNKEEARLVLFATHERFGFGIDMGQGLLPGSRLIFYGFSRYPERRRLIMLMYEHDASVIAQEIDYATFEKKFSEIISYAESFCKKSNVVAVVVMARRAMQQERFRSDLFWTVDISNWFLSQMGGFLRKHFLSLFS
jgi:hypothetical protein